MIAFPLGGIAAGSISLGGRGQLRDWEIFNRPDKGRTPSYAFPSLWVQVDGSKPVARVLESRLQPPYQAAEGLGPGNVPGLDRIAGATFTGEFPLAQLEFHDTQCRYEYVWRRSRRFRRSMRRIRDYQSPSCDTA